MTMNGDHQSLVPAPLDLRTTNRERGTLNCRGRVRDAPPLAESGAVRKRPADKPSSSLPFRKRPIHIEPDIQRQPATPEPSRHRVSPAGESAIRQGVAGQSAADSRVAPASVIPFRNEDGRQHPAEYPVDCLTHADYVNTISYGHYAKCCLFPVPDRNYPWIHTHKHLLPAIALATHQDEDGDTALHIAVVQGNLPIVYELIQLLVLGCKSLDIYNNLRQTPLHLAVITHQANMVEALLRQGADPTALDRNGQTAMHLCCEYNQKECLQVVLSSTAAPTCLEIRNYEGLSPLHMAVQRGHKCLARMLLDAGADINAMDIKSGQSPLMHAVESSKADMAHFLIESGCDVNSQSYSGNTALHNACGRDQADMVRLLLKSGADSSLKNYHNDTPVMVTKNKKITDVLRGRASHHVKIQDTCVSICDNSLTEIGSQSPNHSHGCSPSTTPHTPNHSTSYSPKTSPGILQASVASISRTMQRNNSFQLCPSSCTCGHCCNDRGKKC